MPAINTHASIDIGVGAGKVLHALTDFNTWPIWSPWIYYERDAKIEYRGTPGQTGHGYTWEGNKTGAGEMMIKNMSSSQIECGLTFLKPFKSKADVVFDIADRGDGTSQVTWHMHSSMPFFMFFMVGKMNAMIRGDYERGLRMLKDYLEQGSVPSQTIAEGIVEVPAVNYIGHSDSCRLADIGEKMEASFRELSIALDGVNQQPNSAPFTLYTEMDLKQASCSYTVAMPLDATVTSQIASQFDSIVAGVRPACRALKVVHTGPYRHLANAWGFAISEMRASKIRQNSRRTPFEIYVNDPNDTSPEDLLTEVYLPVK